MLATGVAEAEIASVTIDTSRPYEGADGLLAEGYIVESDRDAYESEAQSPIRR